MSVFLDGFVLRHTFTIILQSCYHSFSKQFCDHVTDEVVLQVFLDHASFQNMENLRNFFVGHFKFVPEVVNMYKNVIYQAR